jgi:hypothetical protein
LQPSTDHQAPQGVAWGDSPFHLRHAFLTGISRVHHHLGRKVVNQLSGICYNVITRKNRLISDIFNFSLSNISGGDDDLSITRSIKESGWEVSDGTEDI